MKSKLLVLSVVLSLLVGGCAVFQKPCTQAGADSLDKAKNTLAQIQQYYDPLQAMVPLIPTAGPILATAIPIALSVADQALNVLGTMIATGCADNQGLNLAQIALDKIRDVFNLKETKQLMAKNKIMLPKGG